MLAFRQMRQPVIRQCLTSHARSANLPRDRGDAVCVAARFNDLLNDASKTELVEAFRRQNREWY